MRDRLHELLRFGSVGAVAFVVDVGLFNLLRFGPGELLVDKPLTAKVLSVTVATVVAWIGNRHWTFAARRTAAPARELFVFAAVNAVTMATNVACLAASHYVLGLTSPLADNVSANLVGPALGAVVRYVAYRKLVFTGSGEVPSAVVLVPAAVPVDDVAPAGSAGTNAVATTPVPRT